MRIIMPDKSVRICPGGPGTVEEVLLSLGINPVEVLVTRDSTLIPETAAVGEDDDEIRIIRVSHGG